MRPQPNLPSAVILRSTPDPGRFHFKKGTDAWPPKYKLGPLSPESYAISTGATAGVKRFLQNNRQGIRGLSWLLLTVLFSQCARPFQPLALETRSYSQNASVADAASEAATSAGLQVAYDTFSILEVSNNRRYAKKAQKQNIKFLPVRLTNGEQDTIAVAQSDLQIFGEYQAVEAPGLGKLRRIRQVSWPYLLFLLFDFGATGGGGEIEIRYNYFFPIGTAYGVSNFVRARIANRQFRQSMQHARFPIVVPPGQTRYALLPVAADAPTDQLQIRYVQD